MTDESAVIQFATRFAKAGFFVFPLYQSNNGAQKPYGWARNDVDKNTHPSKIIPATNSIEYIQQWPEKISAGYRGAKICGYGVMGIGVVIVDLDVKDGKDGAIRFKALKDKYKIPAPALVVKSKSGGYHLYYNKPDRFKDIRVKTLASISVGGTKYDGVDIRGDGGMVVGPLSECSEAEWVSGQYSLIVGEPGVGLSELPADIVLGLVATSFADPLDSMISSVSSSTAQDTNDVMDVLKRGEIPEFLPRGARNHGFYVFINGLRNKGFSPQTAKKYVDKLVAVTEDKEDLHESVNIDEMISRIYAVDINNPFDVAKDLIERGLYRVTGHGNKIKYVIFAENPYYSSIGYHDLASMKQLLDRYTRTVPQPNGKDRAVNPAELLDKLLDQSHEVDIAGFKPGAPDVFYSSEMGGKRYLNVWNDVRRNTSEKDLDQEAWDQFRFIVSRIFGPEGSDEYQFGLDLPAWIIQNPGLKPVVVPFIQSSLRGVGKSCYMNALRHVMGVTKDGANQARTVRLEEIGARFFNPNGASLLMLDEVQFATHRNMRQEATSFWKHLKTLITAPVISVEIKGGGTFEMPCISGMIMAGNSGNHFPIEEADRRIWVIDNNPPMLARGLTDKLFNLESPTTSTYEKLRTANTIRHYLSVHKIKHDLSSMRAPMNDIKREMFLIGLTDLEEWFITHFENPESVAAKASVVTKEMVIYALETSERMINSRWRENPEEAFRELRKRGMVVTVKAKGTPSLTRQMTAYANVTSNGQPFLSKERSVVYTCRGHGEMNNADNTLIKQALNTNVASITDWRKASISNRNQALVT